MDNQSERTESTQIIKDKLIQDLKTVVRDAEDLIRSTAGDLGEKTREARAKLTEAIESAKETCSRLEARAIEGAQATDRIVRQHPYETIGIAFTVGIILGALLKRR